MSGESHSADLIKGLGFIGLALFIAYQTSIAWVGTLLILTIGYFVSQYLIIRKINSDCSDIFLVKIEGGEVALEIDRSELDAYSLPANRFAGAYYMVATLYATLTMLVIKPSLSEAAIAHFSWFIGHLFWIGSLLLFYVYLASQSLEKIAVKIEKSARDKEVDLNTVYQAVLKKISGITEVYQKFGLSSGDSYNSAITSLLDEHIDLIFRGEEVPNKALEEVIREIKVEHSALASSVNKYEAVTKKVRRVSLEVTATGFVGLIDEINEYSKRLKSKSFKLSLGQGDGAGFNEYLETVDDSLDTVLAAIKRKSAHRFNSRNEPVKGRMTERQRACEILGLPNNASMEEVKGSYRKLAQEFHPDKAEQTTDGIKEMARQRFIEIKWAFGVLRAGKY